MLNFGKMHKYTSLTVLFFMQGLIIFAIIDNFGFDPGWIWIACLQYIVLATLVGLMEIRHNIIWWREVPYVLPAKVMNVEDFEKALHEG